MSGVYPMSPDTVKLLRSYLKTRNDASPYLFISNRMLPFDRRTLLVLMKKYGTAAGLPPEKKQFHALKHSIGTHILDAGEDVYFAKGIRTSRTPLSIPSSARATPEPGKCLPAIG